MLDDLTAASLLYWGVAAVGAYFIGTIPTSYIAVRWFKGQDIRRLGDGNAGAANATSILGRRAGLLIGAVDVSKGAVVVALCRSLPEPLVPQMIAGLCAIAGHNWPVYLQGRGGRGAATAVGVLLVIVPLVAVPMSLISLVVLAWLRSTTKALAILYIPIPFLAFWPAGYSYTLVAYSLIVLLFVGFSHYLSVKRRPLSPIQQG